MSGGATEWIIIASKDDPARDFSGDSRFHDFYLSEPVSAFEVTAVAEFHHPDDDDNSEDHRRTCTHGPSNTDMARQNRPGAHSMDKHVPEGRRGPAPEPFDSCQNESPWEFDPPVQTIDPSRNNGSVRIDWLPAEKL